jgi:hypothetical protein
MSPSFCNPLRVLGLLGLGAVLVQSLLAPGVSDVHVVALAHLAANLFLLLYVVSDARRGGLSLMIAFFFCFFVALPAFVQIRADVFPFASTYEARQLMSGYAIVALAQFSYVLSEMYQDKRSRFAVPRSAALSTMNESYYRRAVRHINMATLVLIVYLGPGFLLLTRGERGSAIDIGGLREQLLYVGRSASLVAAVISTYLLLKGVESRRRRGFHYSAAMSFLCFAALNFPPALSRFQLLGPIIALSVVIAPMFKTSVKLAYASVSVIFLVYLFPEIKSLGRGQSISYADALDREVGPYLLRVDFDGFKQIVDTWIYSSTASPRWGDNFLGVAFFWIPRSIWTAKPVDSGLLVATELGYRYTNVSSPLPAEAFVSFGYPGVIAVFVLAAVVVTLLERRAAAALATGGLRQEVLVYAVAAGFAVIILRGALNGVAPMFASGFFILGLLAWRHPRSAERLDLAYA